MDSWYDNILTQYQNSPAAIMPAATVAGNQLTPEQIEARKKLAAALVARRQAAPSGSLPTTFGGGLTALGVGLGDRLQVNRLNDPAYAQMSLGDQMSNLFRGA